MTKEFKIQTLDEILSVMADEGGASDTPKASFTPSQDANPNQSNKITNVGDIGSGHAIKTALADTDLVPLYKKDKRQEYLRWLAFYYLGKRELSAYELAQKLKNKGFEDREITPLLMEFAQKDYQSDKRFAQMLVREAVRKNRGKRYIYNKLQQAKVCMDDLDGIGDMDGLIQSLSEHTAFDAILEDKDDDKHVDWLRLAVEARTKKYGNSIPTEPKDKARQLLFLQYRGFEMGVCFDALKLCLEDC